MLSIVFYTLIFLLVMAVLTAAETAIAHVPSSQLQPLVKRDPCAPIVIELKDAFHLLPVLRGMNILMTIVTVVVFLDAYRNYRAYEHLPVGFEVLFGLFVLAVCGMFFSVFIPYVIARNYALATSLFLARPVFVLYRMSAPLTWLFDWMTGRARQHLGLESEQSPAVDCAELGLIIRRAAAVGNLSQLEAELAANAIRLSERRIGSMMTPRTVLCAIDVTDSPDAVKQKVMQQPHSRYPLINGTLENVEGIVRLMDLMRYVLSDDNARPTLRSLAASHLLVPDSTNALSLLETFKENPSNLAVAFDEYGNVTGVVTLYDLLEAIAGGITGYHTDTTRPAHSHLDMAQRPDGSFLIDGAMAVEDFFEAFNMTEMLEEMEEVGTAYTTVAGFVLARLGHIPKVAETLEVESVRIEVVDMDGNRIDKLLVTKGGEAQILISQIDTIEPEETP